MFNCGPRGGTQGAKPGSGVQRFGALRALGIRPLVSAIRGLRKALFSRMLPEGVPTLGLLPSGHRQHAQRLRLLDQHCALFFCLSLSAPSGPVGTFRFSAGYLPSVRPLRLHCPPPWSSLDPCAQSPCMQHPPCHQIRLASACWSGWIP